MNKYLYIITIFLLPLLSYGQKWEKYLLKEEKYFDIGDYEKGVKQAKNLSAKSTKKLGSKNPYLGIAKVREARNNVGLGLLNEANSVLNNVTDEIRLATSHTTKDIEVLVEAIEANLLLSRYRDASNNYTFADSLYQDLNVRDDDLRAVLDLLDAEIKNEQGYYKKALSIAENQDGYYKKRAETKASNKKELKKRKREYARLLLLKANAYRKMGDYLNADKAFVNTTEWIDDNLGKADILYSECLYQNTLLLEENGLEEKALEKFYDKAHDNTVRKYKPQHLISMSIWAGLIKAKYKAGKKVMHEKEFKAFKKTVNSAFGKKSVYNYVPTLINNDLDIYNGNHKESARRIQSILNKKGLIKIPSKVLEVGLKQGLSSSLSLLQHENAREYHKRLLGLTAHLYGEETPAYHLAKTLFANYLTDFTDSLDLAKEIYSNSFEKIVAPEINEGHKDYIEVLNHRAKLAEEYDHFKEATEILETALSLTKKKYDPNDADYASELEKIASLELKLGSYKQAKDHFEQALVILKNNSKYRKTPHFKAKTLLGQAKLFALSGEYDEAEENIEDAQTLAKKNDFNLESISIDAKEDLVNINIALGKHSQAQRSLPKIVASKQALFGKRSRQMIPSLISMANLNYVTGDYTQTERLATAAIEIATELYEKNSAKLIPALNLLSKAYLAIGDLDKAEQLSAKSLQLVEQRFGKKHLEYAKTLSSLALIRLYKDEPLEEIETLFLQSREITATEIGTNNPPYAEALKHLAIVNISLGKLGQADQYLDQAQSIWERKIGKRNNVKAGEIYTLKGDVKYQSRSYSEADNLYQSALKKYQKFFNEQHPEYVSIQSRLSKTYYMQGDINRSENIIEDVLEKYATFIQEYFPVLSEREKAEFWNKIKPDYEFYNSLIISHKRIDKNLIGKLFDNALITKSLLLSTSKKVRNKILNSKDDELINLYSEWLSRKEFLSYALSLNQEQLSENGVNVNAVTNEVEKLEKELSQKAQAYGNPFATENHSWKDIREVLKPGEVAMEIVRFRYFDHIFTDSVIYAAIYTKQEEKNPGLILLNNGEQLEKRYLKYYRNATKFKLNDRRSYDEFWKRIDVEMQDVGTIFLSVDGVYNQINLESMLISDDTYVIDKSNIVLVNNTKDLLKRGQTRPPAEDVAIMFGNPDFYVSSEPVINNELNNLLRGGGGKISKLPGTAKEIKNVKELLLSKGWTIKDHMDKQAKEGTLKEMMSPKIFHVATHGFFRSDDHKKTGNELILSQNIEAKNPLLKSGLLLTGAGDILNETQYNYNIKDGILTAYEAMNLNLESTELVVLSACETGLGEVQAGEGVFGLQRAFLVAGAQSVIMSLFKVSDEATQKLMVHFYDKWLETGNKRESFIYAKKQIRSTFGHPTYWGPFVMIGLGE